jgi:hypothetical protein
MGDTEYVVEKVLGKRNTNGVIEYKIKWQGYPLDQATWEPKSNLTKITNLIKEYENKHTAVTTNSNDTKQAKQTKLSEQMPNKKVEKTQSRSTAKEKETEAPMQLADIEVRKDLTGLTPKEIETVKRGEAGIECIVSCYDRENDRTIKVMIPSKIFKTFYSDMLVKFYESKLTFLTKKKNKM